MDGTVVVDDMEGLEDVDADTGELTVRPRALPIPRKPSPEVVAHHNLTHFPYRSWCPFCVAGRRPNSQHRSCNADLGRMLPMFHADYCFVRDKEDEDALTVCVGQMSPSKAMFAAMCCQMARGCFRPKPP